MAELGGRATSFLGDQGSFSAVDPRFSLRASLDEQTVLYCSLSGINQFVHPYRNSGVFLLYPTVFWYPSTDKIRPSSLFASLGAQEEMDDETYTASVESFYRITSNLHEFGFNTTSTVPEDLNSSILFGTGRTYGFTCSLQKRVGDLTGSITYNLSWSLEKFAEINAGKEFASPFDRRHELQLEAKYLFGKQWSLNGFCAIASGQSLPATPKLVQPANYRYPLSVNAIVPYGDFLDVNGGRLPGFQRTELSLARRIVLWNVACQFSLRLLNSYGLVDPFVWNLRRSADIRSLWSVMLKKPSLVPRYPVLAFGVRF